MSPCLVRVADCVARDIAPFTLGDGGVLYALFKLTEEDSVWETVDQK